MRGSHDEEERLFILLSQVVRQTVCQVDTSQCQRDFKEDTGELK